MVRVTPSARGEWSIGRAEPGPPLANGSTLCLNATSGTPHTVMCAQVG